MEVLLFQTAFFFEAHLGQRFDNALVVRKHITVFADLLIPFLLGVGGLIRSQRK